MIKESELEKEIEEQEEPPPFKFGMGRKPGSKNKLGGVDQTLIQVPDEFSPIAALQMIQQTMYRHIIRLNKKSRKRSLVSQEIASLKYAMEMIPKLNKEILFKEDLNGDNELKAKLKEAMKVLGDDEDA